MDTLRSKLLRLKYLYEKLLEILMVTGDDQTNYAKRVLARGIESIETELSNSDDKDLGTLFSELSRDYWSMYPPRGGLSEFYIWREDFDERRMANKPLYEIQDEIANIFKLN